MTVGDGRFFGLHMDRFLRVETDGYFNVKVKVTGFASFSCGAL